MSRVTRLVFSSTALGLIPALLILENWFLCYWSSQHELHPSDTSPVQLRVIAGSSFSITFLQQLALLRAETTL